VLFVWVLTITSLLTSLVALYVSVSFRRVSASSQLLKRARDLEVMTADLHSSFESLLASHKRLRSRAGMRELREKDGEIPPLGTRKNELRKFYGLNGLSGPDFARKQMQLEKS